MSADKPLLEIAGLEIDLLIDGEHRPVVHGIDLTITANESLGIVGESGSGKSMTGRAIMRLLPPGARVRGDIVFDGTAVDTMRGASLRRYLARDVAVIHQDPRSHINPVRKVGDYLVEGLVRTRGWSKRDATELAVQTLGELGITRPASRMEQYPHELSGGMLQRVMIAAALMCRPRLILADEPTTGLDVTSQEEVAAILAERSESADGLALIFITHDLDLAAAITDRIAVMYAGHVVEMGATKDVVEGPQHPYTAGLLASRPGTQRVEVLPTIPGHAQASYEVGGGCSFAGRCGFATSTCRTERPLLRTVGSTAVACHYAEQVRDRLHEVVTVTR